MSNQAWRKSFFRYFPYFFDPESITLGRFPFTQIEMLDEGLRTGTCNGCSRKRFERYDNTSVEIIA
jgi:hypothetical protein